MSGGSYDYASYEMENGEVAKACRYTGQALEDLDSALNARFAIWDRQARQERPATDQERMLAELGLAGLRQRVERLARLAREASDMAQELAPLFHELEWWRSGDTGVDSVHAFARKWVKERLSK